MLKLVLTCVVSIFLFASCNTTAQFQKSFDNNQGILAIPLNYIKSNTPDNIAQLINHKLYLEIINVDTKQKISKSVLMSLTNPYLIFTGLEPGEYEVKESYYLKGVQKEHITDESSFFIIKAGEFSVLSESLHYQVFRDGAGEYWLTKQFRRYPYNKQKALKESLESMMPAPVVSPVTATVSE